MGDLIDHCTCAVRVAGAAESAAAAMDLKSAAGASMVWALSKSRIGVGGDRRTLGSACILAICNRAFTRGFSRMATLTAPVRLPVRRFGETARRDTRWIYPLLVFLGLSTFLVYATWAAFQGEHYTFGPYLSPFYSPELLGPSPHSWFG